jgi:hypothetical protein
MRESEGAACCRGKPLGAECDHRHTEAPQQPPDRSESKPERARGREAGARVERAAVGGDDCGELGDDARECGLCGLVERHERERLHVRAHARGRCGARERAEQRALLRERWWVRREEVGSGGADGGERVWCKSNRGRRLLPRRSGALERRPCNRPASHGATSRDPNNAETPRAEIG